MSNYMIFFRKKRVIVLVQFKKEKGLTPNNFFEQHFKALKACFW